jgi:hypothetical protein
MAKQSKFDLVRELALKLDGVEEGTIHGHPSWKFRGKLLCCPAVHKSAEPNSLLVKVAPDDRTERLTLKPDVYYLTDHYQGDSALLVRLSKIDRRALEGLLNRAHQFLGGAKVPAGKKPETKALTAKAPAKKSPAKRRVAKSARQQRRRSG